MSEDSYVIVALPSSDTLLPNASDDPLHVTLIYVDGADETGVVEEAIVQIASELAMSTSPFQAGIAGRGRLGDQDAAVLFVQSDELSNLHDRALDNPYLEVSESFPTWIPHLTMGYGDDLDPDTVRRLPESITFSRIGVWGPNGKAEFPMTGEFDQAWSYLDNSANMLIVNDSPVTADAGHFDPTLHPRGGDGKFIEKWSVIKYLRHGTWSYGKVTEIKADPQHKGSALVTVTPSNLAGETLPGNPVMLEPKKLYAAPKAKAYLTIAHPNAKKTGAQAGSNPGGFYSVPEINDPTKSSSFYVKKAKSKDHGRNEYLANLLYADAGVLAPPVIYNEQDGNIYSPITTGVHDMDDQLASKNTEWLTSVRKSFAVDAWLANHDVFGLTNDNILTDEEGNPWRIDNGGALLFRAMGSPKTDFGDKVMELETFPKYQKQMYGPNVLSKEEILDGVNRILAITPDDIQSRVAQVNLPKSVSDTLIARRAYIADYYGVPLPESMNHPDTDPNQPTTAPVFDPADTLEGKGKSRNWFRLPLSVGMLMLSTGDTVEFADGHQDVFGVGTVGEPLSAIERANQLLDWQQTYDPIDPVMVRAHTTGIMGRPVHEGIYTGPELSGIAWQRGDRVQRSNGATYDVLWTNQKNGGMLVQAVTPEGVPQGPPFILDTKKETTGFKALRWDPPIAVLEEPAAPAVVDTPAVSVVVVEPVPEIHVLPKKIEEMASVVGQAAAVTEKLKAALDTIPPAGDGKPGESKTMPVAKPGGPKSTVLGDGTIAEPGDQIYSKIDGGPYTYVKAKGPYAVVTEAGSEKLIQKKSSTMFNPDKIPVALEGVSEAPKSANGKVPQVGQQAEAKDGHKGTITMISPDGKFVFITDDSNVRKRKSVGQVTILTDSSLPEPEPESKPDLPTDDSTPADQPLSPAKDWVDELLEESGSGTDGEFKPLSHLSLKPGDKISQDGKDWLTITDFVNGNVVVLNTDDKTYLIPLANPLTSWTVDPAPVSTKVPDPGYMVGMTPEAFSQLIPGDTLKMPNGETYVVVSQPTQTLENVVAALNDNGDIFPLHLASFKQDHDYSIGSAGNNGAVGTLSNEQWAEVNKIHDNEWHTGAPKDMMPLSPDSQVFGTAYIHTLAVTQGIDVTQYPWLHFDAETDSFWNLTGPEANKWDKLSKIWVAAPGIASETMSVDTTNYPIGLVPTGQTHEFTNSMGEQNTFVQLSDGSWFLAGGNIELWTWHEMTSLFDMPVDKVNVPAPADSVGYTPKPGDSVSVLSKPADLGYPAQSITLVLEEGSTAYKFWLPETQELKLFGDIDSFNNLTNKYGWTLQHTWPEPSTDQPSVDVVEDLPDAVIAKAKPGQPVAIVTNKTTGDKSYYLQNIDSELWTSTYQNGNLYTSGMLTDTWSGPNYTMTYQSVPEPTPVVPDNVYTGELPGGVKGIPGQPLAILTSTTDGSKSYFLQQPSGGWAYLHSQTGKTGPASFEYDEADLQNKDGEELSYWVLPGGDTSKKYLSGKQYVTDGGLIFSELEDHSGWVTTNGQAGTFVYTNEVMANSFPDLDTNNSTNTVIGDKPTAGETLAVGGYTPKSGETVVVTTSAYDGTNTAWVKQVGSVDTWNKVDDNGELSETDTTVSSTIKWALDADNGAKVVFGDFSNPPVVTEPEIPAVVEPFKFTPAKLDNMTFPNGNALTTEIKMKLGSLWVLPEGHNVYATVANRVFLQSNTGAWFQLDKNGTLHPFAESVMLTLGSGSSLKPLLINGLPPENTATETTVTTPAAPVVDMPTVTGVVSGKVSHSDFELPPGIMDSGNHFNYKLDNLAKIDTPSTIWVSKSGHTVLLKEEGSGTWKMVEEEGNLKPWVAKTAPEDSHLQLQQVFPSVPGNTSEIDMATATFTLDAATPLTTFAINKLKSIKGLKPTDKLWSYLGNSAFWVEHDTGNWSFVTYSGDLHATDSGPGYDAHTDGALVHIMPGAPEGAPAYSLSQMAYANGDPIPFSQEVSDKLDNLYADNNGGLPVGITHMLVSSNGGVDLTLPPTELFVFNQDLGRVWKVTLDGSLIVSPKKGLTLAQIQGEPHNFHLIKSPDQATMPTTKSPAQTLEEQAISLGAPKPDELSKIGPDKLLTVPEGSTWVIKDGVYLSLAPGEYQSNGTVTTATGEQVQASSLFVKASLTSDDPATNWTGKNKPSEGDVLAWDGPVTKDGYIPTIGLHVKVGKFSGKIIGINKAKTKVTVLTGEGKTSLRQIDLLSIDYAANYVAYAPQKPTLAIPEGMPLAVDTMADALTKTAKDGKWRSLLPGQEGIRNGEMIVTGAMTPSGKTVNRVIFTLTKAKRIELRNKLSGEGEPPEKGDWASTIKLSHFVEAGDLIAMRYSTNTSSWKPDASIGKPPSHKVDSIIKQDDGTFVVTMSHVDTGEVITSIFQPNRDIPTYTWDPDKVKPVVLYGGEGPFILSAAAKAEGWKVTNGSTDAVISGIKGGALGHGQLQVEPGLAVPNEKAAFPASGAQDAAWKPGGLRLVSPDGVVIEVTSMDSSDNSYKGNVVITLPENAGPEVLNNALDMLSVAHAPLTQSQAKANVLPMLRTMMSFDKNDIDTDKGMSAEMLFTKAGSTLGIDDLGWQDVLVGVDESNGKVSYFWSERVRTKMKAMSPQKVTMRGSHAKTADFVVSNALHGSANAVIKRIGGLIYAPSGEGVGASPGSDASKNAGHGSFNSSFPDKALKSSNPLASYAGVDMIVYTRPEAVFGRITDFRISVDTDAFGNPTAGSNALKTILTHTGSMRDFLVNGGIPAEATALIAVSTDQLRNGAIAKLHEMGINEINGTKVEDFIILKSQLGSKTADDLPPVFIPPSARPILDLPESYGEVVAAAA